MAPLGGTLDGSQLGLLLSHAASGDLSATLSAGAAATAAGWGALTSLATAWGGAAIGPNTAVMALAVGASLGANPGASPATTRSGFLPPQVAVATDERPAISTTTAIVAAPDMRPGEFPAGLSASTTIPPSSDGTVPANAAPAQTPTAVPEPASLVILASALGLAVRIRQRSRTPGTCQAMVGPVGIEPTTIRLKVGRSTN